MSYYSYGNRGGFLSNIPAAVKNIIIINVLVMVMISLNQEFMVEKFALFYPTSPSLKGYGDRRSFSYSTLLQDSELLQSIQVWSGCRCRTGLLRLQRGRRQR